MVGNFKKLAESLKLFLGNRFRSDNDVQRILFSLDAVYSGNAVLKIVSDPKPWRKALNFFKNVEWESYMDNDDSDKLQEEILKFKPKFFCINSGNTCSKERKIKIKNFLECCFRRHQNLSCRKDKVGRKYCFKICSAYRK